MMQKRTKLASANRHNKDVDMDWVYSELDKGRTVKSVAQELKISESTLRRRHKEYQSNISTTTNQLFPDEQQLMDILSNSEKF